MQTDLPLLTELDEEAIKTFTKEFEVRFLINLLQWQSVDCTSGGQYRQAQHFSSW
jgi:hypothetical protein